MNHYAVDGVDNGNDAFDFASSDEYDGLVLDIMMPGMDGVTLLKKLRANGITTPALFLTAKTETYQKIEGPRRRSTSSASRCRSTSVRESLFSQMFRETPQAR